MIASNAAPLPASPRARQPRGTAHRPTASPEFRASWRSVTVAEREHLQGLARHCSIVGATGSQRVELPARLIGLRACDSGAGATEQQAPWLEQSDLPRENVREVERRRL
jgi:hypothetical protein